MNARCTCEAVPVRKKDGTETLRPGRITEGCPVHWAAGRRDWTGHEASAAVPGLARYRRRLIYPCRTLWENEHTSYEWETTVDRLETSAEVQRRLYQEARP